MRICVRLAATKNEYEQAYWLLNKRYQLKDSDGLWLLKQHALPSTNTIVAMKGEEVVGALSLFGESAFTLPLEQYADLSAFRESLGGRMCELSAVGIADGYPRPAEIHQALHHFALCFGSSYCLYDVFLTQVPEPSIPFRQLPNAPGVHFCQASETPDLRRQLAQEIQFAFPEKKSYLVAHQSIDCETLDYLFNRRTGLFERLTDLDLRVLKNYYDHESFAAVLPKRSLKLPFEKTPKHRRFPMNCEGFLCGPSGRKMHLHVLDVSREGLKVRSEEAIPAGSYPLTLSIGVVKRAEVIAATIWTDGLTRIAGFSVKSGDNHWRELVEYLEQESLKTAA